MTKPGTKRPRAKCDRCGNFRYVKVYSGGLKLCKECRKKAPEKGVDQYL